MVLRCLPKTLMSSSLSFVDCPSSDFVTHLAGKPFIYRNKSCFTLFRYSITKAFVVAFVLTFFSMLDVPVFWPILLFYWVVLFVLTMKRQIMHMIKYKYIPFDLGKQKYTGKKFTGGSSSRAD